MALLEDIQRWANQAAQTGVKVIMREGGTTQIMPCPKLPREKEENRVPKKVPESMGAFLAESPQNPSPIGRSERI
jgi:hypothetical protein